MNRPSSTITAATIGGALMTVVWELLAMFTALDPTAALVAATTTLVAAVAGYFRKETVIK